MSEHAMRSLDTVREVYTPEGVALRLPAAGPVPRALAWLIDSAVRFSLLFVVSIVAAMLDRVGAGVYLIAYFVIFWAYPILFEVLWDGQTPGKRVMSLRVISDDGAPVGWLASIVRNLLRTVDFLPFGYATGLVAGFFDPWGRRLGDMVARTMVIHAPATAPAPRVQVDGAHAPAQPLRPQEQAAVIAFADRASQLTQARREELADIAAPVVGSGGALGALRLQGVANWLLGRQ
ncbi:RDD family protein [Lysobacter brunescens]|uniref:RDD family protein n=1 Tax=Lysobacter brunescens TaxID=262323 RepID=A0ABW2Y952_9GAMM